MGSSSPNTSWSDLAPSMVNEAFTGGLDFLGGWFATDHNAAIAEEQNYRTFNQQRQLNYEQKEYQKELARYGLELEKQAADYSKSLRDQSLQETPALQRAGLVAAGYNPILAVNSAGGQPFSTSLNASIPGASSSTAPHSSSAPSAFRSGADVLDTMAKMAAIRSTNAQTDLTVKRTLGEGWTIKTLTAGEARGLGASLLGQLGFHFNGSDHQTFLVAYNPITGELRNLGDTKNGLGTTGPTTNAADVPDGSVDVSIEQPDGKGGYFWKLLNNPVKSPLR